MSIPPTTLEGQRFAPGSLVRARGREWVVLPDSTQDLLVLRPLGGNEDEVAGVLVGLETVEPAHFGWPDPTQAGDHLAARLLADAVRIGLRASAGPFRSFGAIAVEPRPYQLVPLMMALRLDPVRLLIADDVGIGKTIEAGLIAKELLMTGEAKRLCVLCPPHLAEQWQLELSTKFHIDTELVLASTISRLERSCEYGESIFDVFPRTVVSLDVVKTDRRYHEFARSAPDLVIVDEAHTCVTDVQRGPAHQRFRLLKELAADPSRHLLLVTATPHSGNEGAFRALIGLLDDSFAELPDDEAIDEATRGRLARHFVQRRRADIRAYLAVDTTFPDRLELPERDGGYHLTPAYRELLQDVLALARETVSDSMGNPHRQRVQWWSILALLRSLASSPAAAAATLRNRAAPAATTTLEEADDVGRRTVLDLDDADDTGRPDTAPGADPDPDEDEDVRHPGKARLRKLAGRADTLGGAALDAKLEHATRLVRQLVDEHYNPIVFCRFIPTADYVAEHLRRALPEGVMVDSVTGLIPPSEREDRVQALGASPARVLVATDCLSEGINLQEYFDAVVHYDLPWNPTRLEQREGRVDRYGQPSPTVKVATIYGVDNVIDELVLEVLLRKHRRIRSELGISIPVPGSNDEFIESVFERLFSKDNTQLSLFAPPVQRLQETLFAAWDTTAAREKRSRARYAQHALSPDEVAAELAAVRSAVGGAADVARFVRTAVRALGGRVEGPGSDPTGEPVEIDFSGLPLAARDYLGPIPGTILGRYDPTIRAGETYLSRTHPLVAGLAAYLTDSTLDPETPSPARRCGAIRTSAVETTTSVLVVRLRFDVVQRSRQVERRLLAEEVVVVAFEGSPSAPRWIDPARASALLDLVPTANIDPAQRIELLRQVIDHQATLAAHLEAAANDHAHRLAEAHMRVRQQRKTTARIEVLPHLPVDVLGLYLYLPD